MVRQVEGEGRILGFSVLKINRVRREYPVGFIVDMIASPSRWGVADRLIADAVDYFDDRSVNIVNGLIIKGQPFERIYGGHGFLDSGMHPHLYLHFSYGDIDSLRYTPTCQEIKEL